jgi:hypothetical protein
MRINKIYMKEGKKIKVKNVKIFIKDGKVNIINDTLRMSSSKGEQIYIYVKEAWISWKPINSNKLEGLNEVLEDIKVNGKSNY